MPPAVTVLNADGSSTKVFEWRMLLKDIGGRQKMVDSREGEIERFPEAFIVVCDIIRTRWISKYYRVLYRFRPGKGFEFPEGKPRLLDTWHTCKAVSFSGTLVQLTPSPAHTP
jgi:hypothetical protein